jgi:hypothetical protein
LPSLAPFQHLLELRNDLLFLALLETDYLSEPGGYVRNVLYVNNTRRIKMSKKKLNRGITWNTLPERINKVRDKILSAGNTIGSVTFEKRTDETTRRMSFRLHAKHPSFAPAPSSNNTTREKNREKNIKNLQLTN